MDIPENCRECQFTHTCKAWHYGGEKCVYEHNLNCKEEEAK